MSKPDDVSQMAWSKAFEIMDTVPHREAIATAIDAAVTEQREKDAVIADRVSWSNKWSGSLGPEQNCVRVAAAIRKAPQ